ncbi:MAG: hypothetical protein LBL83_05470 [Clostridiales bacterium]|jgi:hypothetical protein|nr:hypothetical protein [Clostridiales bacterium]
MNKSEIKMIESVLGGKSAAQIKDLLVELCKKIPAVHQHVLLWGKTAGNGENERLALEYWARAEAIIDSFNTYGGGPEDEEDECCDEIERLSQLIPELSWETRQEIMDGMLEQYHYGNSGFDDMLTDTCFELCREREEWLYLAERLLEYGGSWDKNLAMNVYKTIGDDSAFLALREKDLRYGSDYFELVSFYDERGDVEKALSYAHKGLKNGDGYVEHLVQYLFDHYAKKEDTGALEALMRTCGQIEKERALVSRRLFEYYKNRGDYGNAKKHALKEFEYSEDRDLDKLYGKIKEYMNESDWQAARDKLFGELKQRDSTGYLNICLDEGRKQEVHDAIFEKKPASRSAGFWGSGGMGGIDRDYYADKLRHDFPEDISKYFAELALKYVEGGAGPERRGYKQAVSYYRKVRDIYVQILKDEPRWEQLLADMKERYKKRRAFLEEIRELEEAGELEESDDLDSDWL